jgi:anti-sigma28 factor (negative regulator of flagellin synthesis)|tara:strand:+ start:149 stop:406 length:258 start_codon:yes stop_codon:yes gene_type:complete
MAQVLKSYLNTITSLEETIDKEVDGILRVIDVDQLLDNPEAYMQEISKQFFESLDDELKQAIEAGELKADRIINSIESTIQKSQE